jgi:hypothetical protein
VKRLVGYACRRYTVFASEVFDRQIDLGVRSRLPAASRPNPKPISEKYLRELGVAAKQLFPLETSFSFRVWIQFLSETGCRRSERNRLELYRLVAPQRCGAGKTGERELPLSRKMRRNNHLICYWNFRSSTIPCAEAILLTTLEVALLAMTRLLWSH